MKKSNFLFTIFIFSVIGSLGAILDAAYSKGFVAVCSLIYLCIAFGCHYTSNYNEKERLLKTISDLTDKLHSAEYNSNFFANLSEKLEKENNNLRQQLSEHSLKQ